MKQKYLILSVDSETLSEALNGKPTLVFSLTAPKPFDGKIDMLFHCKSKKPYLYRHFTGKCFTLEDRIKVRGLPPMNGCIVARDKFFECKDVYVMSRDVLDDKEGMEDILGRYSKMTFDELKEFVGDKKQFYCFFVVNAKSLKEPVKLAEMGLKREPKTWCFAEVDE